MEKLESLGARLRKLREDSRLNQADAAAALEISRAYLSKLETDGDAPGRELIFRIADFYRVSFEWLRTGEGEPKTTPSRPLEPDEALLLSMFRELPKEEAALHLELIRRRVRPS